MNRYDIELGKVEKVPAVEVLVKPKRPPPTKKSSTSLALEALEQRRESMRIYPAQLLVTSLLSALYTSCWWYMLLCHPTTEQGSPLALVAVLAFLSIAAGSIFIVVMAFMAIITNWNRAMNVD
jgi:hypothetical protein